VKYGKRDNEIAEAMRASRKEPAPELKPATWAVDPTSREFLNTPEWKALRRQVVKKYGRQCMKCGHTPANPRHTNVDHIKPRKLFPWLALVFENLQVLCGRCNKKKGNIFIADYRLRIHKKKRPIKNFEHMPLEEVYALKQLARRW
jgi:hypothetical protein